MEAHTGRTTRTTTSENSTAPAGDLLVGLGLTNPCTFTVSGHGLVLCCWDPANSPGHRGELGLPLPQLSTPQPEGAGHGGARLWGLPCNWPQLIRLRSYYVAFPGGRNGTTRQWIGQYPLFWLGWQVPQPLVSPCGQLPQCD